MGVFDPKNKRAYRSKPFAFNAGSGGPLWALLAQGAEAPQIFIVDAPDTSIQSTHANHSMNFCPLSIKEQRGLYLCQQ